LATPAPYAWNPTCSSDKDWNTVGVGDVETQTRRIVEIIERALSDAGASLADVVRTRMLLVNMEDWETVGRVHSEVFEADRPASLMCQVGRFIDPAWLVEIEAEALIDDKT
jgi:enamine deaminase RidA (YjgF/YER057c/UK114 family)